MKISVKSESIDSIIERQLKLWEVQKTMAEKESDERRKVKPVITISRTMGALGEEVASKLSRLTGFQLFDKEIMDTIAGKSGIQKKIVELLDETDRSDFKLWFDGTMKGKIFGKTDYMKSLTKAIGSIIKHGEAILVGRGANIILGPERGFHLRIIASREVRIERVVKQKNISLKEARALIKESDKHRALYVRKSFGIYMGDPTFYDLTISTDFMNEDDAVELALLGYSKKKSHLYK